MARCQNNYKASSVQVFFALPTTMTSKSCFDYWNKLDPSTVKNIEFADTVLVDACQIHAISGDAYELFKKSLNGVSCQSVFTNWKNGEFEVTFWMKDLGNAAPPANCTQC